MDQFSLPKTFFYPDNFCPFFFLYLLVEIALNAVAHRGCKRPLHFSPHNVCRRLHNRNALHDGDDQTVGMEMYLWFGYSVMALLKNG
jgi:hypothetical protein